MSRLETDNNRIKSASIKIKIFLHRQRWKEVLIFFSFPITLIRFLDTSEHE